MDIWFLATIISVIVIVFGLAAIVILSTMPHSHGLSIVNTHTLGTCQVYNICINIKINGHPVIATVDTGIDFTLIPSSYSNSLGLSNLPTSTILGRDVPFSGINGGATTLKSVNVILQLENTRPFYAGVLLNQGDQPPVILLSLHDLYQAYRLQFVPLK